MYDFEEQLKAIMFSILKNILLQDKSIRKIEIDSRVYKQDGVVPLCVNSLSYYYDMKFIKSANGTDVFVIFDKLTLSNQLNIPSIFEDLSLALIFHENEEIELSLGKTLYDYSGWLYHPSTEIKGSFLQEHIERDLKELLNEFNLMYKEIHN